MTHLLLPDDLDLEGAVLRVRNKPKLGWRVKTRNERDIPLLAVLVDVLRWHLGQRSSGPVFRRRKFTRGQEPLLAGLSAVPLGRELASRIVAQEIVVARSLSRSEQLLAARTMWRDLVPSRRIEFGWSSCG